MVYITAVNVQIIRGISKEIPFNAAIVSWKRYLVIGFK